DPCLAECGSVSEPSGCLECALQGDECEEEYALCLQDPTCLAYEQCSQSCNDVACTQRCNETYPDGAATYGTLFYCLNCAPTRVRCSVPCMNALCTLP
ncbi:MAG TPA: hypothetical protein VFB62_07095, partial [Polyangiaceae bacterium]|nr:hypothetical protein [Polyangiaceae bacterium]